MGRISVKRMLKLLSAVLIILIVVYLTAAVVLWRFLPKEQIRAVIMKELSSRLNQDITMSEFSLGFYPGVEFVARDMRVVDPLTSQEILSARRMRFDLDVGELLNRVCVIEDITVDSLTLNLIRDANGAWNVEKLIGRMKSEEKQPKTTQSVNWLEFGYIHIDNGSIRVHDELTNQHLSISDLETTVNLRTGKLHIDSASISSPAIEAELSGTVSQFSEPNPVFNINATLDIIKEDPIAEFLPKDLPAGATVADLSIDASGQLTKIALNTTFSFNPLATAEITTRGSIVGTLQIEEGIFEIATLKTYFGESTLSLSGTCNNIWQKERTAHLEGKTRIALEETIALIGKELFSSLELKGGANATMTLNTSMEQVGLKTNINIHNAGFTIPQVMRKKRGIPGTLAVDAHYTILEELVIDNFKLVIDNAKLDGKMQVKTRSEQWLMTSFTTLDFPLESLNRLPAIRFDEGTVTLAAEVWQASQDQGGMRYRGDATVEHATLLLQALQEPIRDLEGRIEVDNDKVHAHSASFAFSESRYQAQAEVTDFSNPRIVGQLSTDALDINEIVSAFAKTKTSAEKSTSSKAVPQPDFSIEVLVEADSMCFGNVRTGTFSTIWRTQGLVPEPAPFHIDAFGGELKGVVDLAILENGTGWVIDFSVEDIALEIIFDQLLEGKRKGERKGLLSVEGSLSGIASGKSEDIWRSMDGTLTLTATDGEIKQSPLLNSMLLAMRFSTGSIPLILLDTVKTLGRSLNVKRMKFKKIDGTFQLAGGVARTEDLFFDGETLDLFFKGDLDLVREQMDMKIKATTPTGTIGSLLGKVPVVGKGWDKTKKSILSLNFIAQGPISNPKVQLSTVDKLKPKRKKRKQDAP